LRSRGEDTALLLCMPAFYTRLSRWGSAHRICQRYLADGRLRVKRTMFHLQNLLRFNHRTDAQSERLNSSSLNGAKIETLEEVDGQRLIICASDLNSGCACGFCSTHLMMHSPITLAERHSFANGIDLPYFETSRVYELSTDFRKYPLAGLVSASGAFPLAFNAVDG
jgi:hypothetical protein